ncbi:MAG: hypothetical protein ABFS10_04180 [Bacteroidota bacterium]
MKRLALIIGFIWTAGLHLASGQVIGSLGVKAGMSLSNQTYRITPIEYIMGTNAVVGPAMAFFIESFRGENFSLQTDLYLVCRGSSTTTHSVTIDHTDGDRVVANLGEPLASRHRYLSIAPMLRAKSYNGGVEPYALFGPRIDRLIYYSTESEYPLEEQNSWIMGLTMGVGVEFSLNGRVLFGEIQYQPDLSPVTNREPLLVNNNSLLFTLGIRWMKAP